ncbi:MAG: carotenoid biosynthesis protein [Bacteroidales bacterium]|nr:carotenoid biosynthesis protein [Bacteroidales bacterium]
MNNLKLSYSVIFLIIFYFVGIAGFMIPATNSLFKNLIPLAILLSAVLLILFHKPGFTITSIIVFIVIAVLSFFVEALGVKTGNIFGQYTYGNTLGPKLADTPLLIGINWLMLIYCTKVITDSITVKKTIRIIAPPLLMVIYDLVLEKAAPVLGMWSWAGGEIPQKNYIAWFCFSLLFILLIRFFKLSFSNKLAPYVLITQFIFFIIIVTYFKLIIND